VSAGDFHTCVLNQEGALTCVGRNRDGQRVQKPGPYKAVAAGDAHTCALGEDGIAECWGKNDAAQSEPPPDVTFTQITAGESFNCGIRELDGKAQCWGSDSSNRASPPADVSFVSLDAGRAHACGLTTDKKAVCWGEVSFRAPPLTNVKQVVAGNWVSCALLEDQSARCWPGDEAQEIPLEGAFVSLAAGHRAVCLTQATGNLICEGYETAVVNVPDAFYEQ
jgi:alpha-tubulin suppressor-like RCC1 family protein